MDAGVMTKAAPVAISAGKKVLTHLKKVAKKRNAQPFQQTGIRNNDVDEHLNKALIRLSKLPDDCSLWKRAQHSVENLYQVPKLLKASYVRDWLEVPNVKNLLKRIALQNLLKKEVDDTTLLDLMKTLSIISGDNEQITLSILYSTLNYLALEVENALKNPVDTQLILSAVALHTDDLKEQAEGILQNVASVQEHHTLDALEELERILQSRFCVTSATIIAWFKQLEADVSKGGRYSSATHVKDSVKYWIARFEAGENKFEKAKCYLRDNPSGEHNLAVLRALILLEAGDIDKAIQLLQRDDTADSRTCLFCTLIQYRGEREALNWLDRVEIDKDYFSLLGWIKAIELLVLSGRLAEAIALIDSDCGASIQSFPAGNMTIANALICKSFPKQFHKEIFAGNILHLIEFVQDGKPSKQALIQAEEYYGNAYKQATSLKLKDVAECLGSILSSLRFIDPKRADVEHTRLKSQFDKFPEALNLLGRVIVFNVEVDWSFFDKYFSEIELCRLLTFEELAQRYSALCYRKLYSQAIKEVESYWDKFQKEERSYFASKLVDAYINNDELEAARSLLDSYGSYIPQEVSSRLKLKLQGVAGDSPIEGAFKLYNEQPILTNLKNLLVALESGHNFERAEQYALKLFQEEYRIANAIRYVSCAFHNGQSVHFLLEFLEDCSELVDESSQLAFYKSLCLYDVGRIIEAQRCFPKLNVSEQTEQTISLEVNIALALGKYDQLSEIINKIFSERANYTAGFLLSMANAVVYGLPDVAFSLAETAVEHEPQVQSVLLSAQRIASLAGKDDLASKWVYFASKVENKDSLVETISLSEAVSIIEQRGKSRESVFNSFQHAKIPIHLLVEQLSLPLSYFYLTPYRCSDVRSSGVQPLMSFSTLVDYTELRTISLDVTTIMALYSLGVLREVFDSFESVYVSPSIMFILHREYSYIYFHQPQQIKKSKDLISLFRNQLVVHTDCNVSNLLIEEIGVEDAQLFLTAKQEQGVVVHPGEIYQTASLMEKVANLSEFQLQKRSLHELVYWLYENAEIDDEKYNESKLFLERNGDKFDDIDVYDIEFSSVCLTSLSIEYLYQLDLLSVLLNSDLKIYIHQRRYDEWNDYVRLENDTTKLVEDLKNIRKIIQQFLAKDKLKFLPRKFSGNEPQIQRYDIALSGVIDSLGGTDHIDAVAYDDRFLCSYGWIPSDEREIPILNSYDILKLVQVRGGISKEQYLNVKMKLHNKGQRTFPVQAEEIFSAISKCKSEGGKLKENKKIRLLREQVSFVLGSNFLTTKERLFIVDNCLIEAINLLSLIWNAPSKSDDDVYTRANWVLNFLLPPISDVVLFLDDFNAQTSAIVDRMLHPLLVAPNVKASRLECWKNWLQVEVLDKLLPANVRLLENLQIILSKAMVAAVNRVLSAEVEPITVRDMLWHKRQCVLNVLSNLPDKFANQVFNQDEIVDFCELRGRIGNLGTIRFDRLDKVYQSVEQTDTKFLVELLDGETVSVHSPEVGVLHFTNDDDETVYEMTGLELFSKNADIRSRTIDDWIRACGFPPAYLEQLRGELTEGPISPVKMHVAGRSLTNSPTTFFGTLESKLQSGEALCADLLFPSSKQYYEMLIGPETGASAFDIYLKDTLRPQYTNYLKENAEHPLAFFLAAALRSDIASPNDVKLISNSSLIDWIAGCKDDLTPFEILGLMPILNSRKSSENEFAKVIDEFIDRLCSERFLIGNTCLFYEMFAPLVRFCLVELDRKEELYGAPIYWKRLAAFVHCQQLIKVLKRWVDSETFIKWCSDNSKALVVNDLINFQSEPLWVSFRLTPSLLKAQVADRLVILSNQIELSEIQHDAIVNYLENLSVETKFLTQTCEPLRSGRNLEINENVNTFVDVALRNDPKFSVNRVVDYLFTLSFWSKIGKNQCAEIIKFISKQDMKFDDSITPENYFNILYSLAGIAGTQSITELSEIVSEMILRDCQLYIDVNYSKVGLNVLLFAAAAFKNEEARRDWLEEKIHSYVLRVPKKSPAEACCSVLEEFDKMLSFDKQLFNREIRLLKSCM